MADDDGAGPHHAEDVPSVEPRRRDLRVVGVDAAQHEAEPQAVEQPAHAIAEKARAGAEVLGRQGAVAAPRRPVRLPDAVAHDLDLGRELVVGQGARRLVVHGVVAELGAAADHVGEGLLPPGDLAADDEERGRGAVPVQRPQDLLRVLGGRVVDGQRHDLVPRRHGHLPQHVGPPPREVRDQRRRRLVDHVEGDQEEEREDGQRCEGRHPPPSRSAAQLRREAEDYRDAARHWRSIDWLVDRSIDRFGFGCSSLIVGGSAGGRTIGRSGDRGEKEVGR